MNTYSYGGTARYERDMAKSACKKCRECQRYRRLYPEPDQCKCGHFRSDHKGETW